MSLYDDASLIITPNAYKTSKLYSIKPTDGSGDLSVVRVTTATRVNEQGLIEDCPYNLTKYSEQSDSWSMQNGVVSTEPIGAFYLDNNKTAIKYTVTGVGFNQFYINTENSVIGNQYTLTGYLKSNTVPFYHFDLPCFIVGQRPIYDNTNKTIISTPVGVDFQVDELLDNWIYFRISYTSQNVSNYLSLKLYSSTSNSSYLAGVPIGTEVLATKIQVIKGSVDKPYFKTTDRLNIPRLDYTNGSCPSILVEPQRTNLVFPSATATTQSRSVTATAHTLSFYGTGSVVLSGVATGTLIGTDANDRVTLTFTPTAGTLILTVVGSVTNWQLEAGSNATSYIPTVASAVTRNADVISKTGISDLIGQTEGTIFVDFNKTFSDSSIKYLFYLFQNGSNRFVFYVENNDVVLIPYTDGAFIGLIKGALNEVGRNKVLYKYTANGVLKLFINGILRGSMNLGNLPVFNTINIGSQITTNQLNDSINLASVYKTALTDAECIALTTL